VTTRPPTTKRAPVARRTGAGISENQNPPSAQVAQSRRCGLTCSGEPSDGPGVTIAGARVASALKAVTENYAAKSGVVLKPKYDAENVGAVAGN
jgi:hypothetical protein